MVEWKKELRLLKHPYFIVNFFLSASFFATKTIPPICSYMYENCFLEFREYEIFIFLACAVTVKNKRQISLTNYIAHFCMFTKICNVVMFFQQNLFYAIVYVLCWLIQASFLHQPVYRGPDKVLYFNEITFNDEVIKGDSRIVWFIEFYAAWSPACVSFAPIFSELSEEYGIDNFKFGKIDITRFPDLARMYKIDTSSWSKQLPTLAIFRQGKEVERRPAITIKGTVPQRFTFSWDQVVRAFGLNELFNECKKNPIKKAAAKPAAVPITATTETKNPVDKKDE